MGKVKDLQIEIRATMSESTFQGIPEHLRDEMTIKAVEVTNWKDEYKKDEDWTRLNKEFIETLKARQEREERIRVNGRNEPFCETCNDKHQIEVDNGIIQCDECR